MNLQILKTELDTDPLVRGYAGMTDSEAADDLNTEYRSRNKTTMSGSEAFDQTDSAEYAALTADQKSEWLSLCGIDNHDPFGPSTDVVVAIFGGGSTTVSNLQAFRVETISRGVELNLGIVTSQQVIDARAIV